MDLLLTVDNAGKKYSRDFKSSLRSGARGLMRSYLRERSGETKGATLDVQEFWAIRDVSFELRRGEVLGILGQNGAGKSTLLKCIAGKLKLDTGRVELNGRIGHLLEMSAGFEPALTGRENVRMRGRLMNLVGKELDHYVEEVADFAELDEFFDSPVQFYSSGMRSRLGFSASSVMKPDVLILDEVLAVGDLSFRLKCYQRINEMTREAAVLFVSHSLGQVSRMCNRGIFLQKGRVIHDGNIQQAIALYQERLGDINENGKRHTLNAELVDLVLYVSNSPLREGQRVSYGEQLALAINISRLPKGIQVRILLKEVTSNVLMEWNSTRSDIEWPADPGWLMADIGNAEFNPGAYSLSVLISSSDGLDQLCLSDSVSFRVTGELFLGSALQRLARWTFLDKVEE
ncbi:ABC transporter ATP-binding protein [Methyloversatilis sp. XJ19-49]|uniref:ABC transporter ATP-binding protein n=1 Tax=Methyloversatilis sp. XJ19-49 TaxID=2963429 RepID=UPI00211BCE95|nr:ABC transporter ATP-binding protein [Methyloversatilis sp. XJ19-49]MCQ9378575.1 ABC transporter ATP-binding protein [Methyloversatilis sp. XJ19-49]